MFSINGSDIRRHSSVVILGISIIIVLSCHSNNEHQRTQDKVKWDFYKKNTLKHFENDTVSIPFYQSDLRILKDYSESGLRCYMGEFYSERYSFNSNLNSSMNAPTVYSICYDSTMAVKAYYLDDNAVVNHITPIKESEEDRALLAIIEKIEVCSFLKEYSKIVHQKVYLH